MKQKVVEAYVEQIIGESRGWSNWNPFNRRLPKDTLHIAQAPEVLVQFWKDVGEITYLQFLKSIVPHAAYAFAASISAHYKQIGTFDLEPQDNKFKVRDKVRVTIEEKTIRPWIGWLYQEKEVITKVEACA